jgi:penicillin G amidase
VRDQLGSDYLKVFDLDWQPKGVLPPTLAANDWKSLGALAQLSDSALSQAMACRSLKAATPGSCQATHAKR